MHRCEITQLNHWEIQICQDKKTKRLFKLLISTSFNYGKLGEITLKSILGILQVKHLAQQEQSFSQLGALGWQGVIKECWLLEHDEIAFNMMTATASVGRNHLGRKKKGAETQACKH